MSLSSRRGAHRFRDAGVVLVRLAGFQDQQLASLDRWLQSDPADK